MKKILCLVLVLVVAGGLLFAGGSGGSSGGKTKVEYWGHANVAWNAAYDDMISKFNASQSDIQVVGTYFPYGEFEAKVQTSLMTRGAGADVYCLWGGWVLDFPAESLQEVPASFINDIVNDCYEPVVGALIKNGKYYGVPIEFNNEYGGMFVDKIKFQQLGIPYPKTWNEIIDVAKKYTVRRGDIFDYRGLDFPCSDTLGTTFLSMILCKGGQYWVNNKFSFTNSIAQEAFQTLANYILVDRITNLDSATGAAGLESFQFLGVDQALMSPRGPWAASSLETEYGKKLGVDFDYVAFPFYDGPVKAFPAETGWSLSVPSTTKVPEAAWKFVSFYFEPDNLMRLNVACAQIPPRKSIAQNPAFVRQAPIMEPVLGILQYGKFWGPVNSDVVKADILQVFISFCQGEYPNVAAAMAALENQLNTELRL